MTDAPQETAPDTAPDAPEAAQETPDTTPGESLPALDDVGADHEAAGDPVNVNEWGDAI